MRPITCAVTLLIALTSIGCGQSAQGKREAKAKAAAHQRDLRRAKRARLMRVEYAACTQMLGPLQNGLSGLQSRLSVGMTYDRYSNKVADAQVLYDRIDFDALGTHPICLTGIGLSLEKALNQYVKAAGEWNDCLTDIYCDNDSIDPGLQARWSRASRAIETAKTGMKVLQPSGSR